MVEYLLSLPGIQDVTMEDGTTAFAMALGRRDLQMIKAFMNSNQLSGFDHINGKFFDSPENLVRPFSCSASYVQYWLMFNII